MANSPSLFSSSRLSRLAIFSLLQLTSFCTLGNELLSQDELPMVSVEETANSVGVEALSTHDDLTVDQTELESSWQRSAAETLRGRPGLVMQKSGEGSNGALQIRGAMAGQNSTTLDGVPLLTTLPGLNWLDALPSEALGQITVNTGNDHAFYSAQGLNGSVQLSSKRIDKSDVLMHVEGGSFGALRETASGAWQGDDLELRVTGSRQDYFDGVHLAPPQNGRGERDPMHGTTGIGRYEKQINNNLHMDGSLLYRDGWWATDDYAGFNGRPYLIDDNQSWFSSKLWLAQNTISANLNPSWNSRLQLAITDNAVSSEISAYPMSADVRLMFADWRNQHQLLAQGDDLASLRAIWGGQMRHESGKQEQIWINDLQRARRSLYTGFFELQAERGPWYGEGGVRLEASQNYGVHANSHFAGRWQPHDNLLIRSSGGNNFRPPDNSETLTPLVHNNGLAPESGYTIDVGLEWTPNKNGVLAVTGFHSRYKQLINTQIGEDGFFWFTNVPQVRIQGVEASWQQRWLPALKSGIDYTYQQSRNLNTHTTIASHPDHSARLWTQWDIEQMPLSLRLTVHYRSGYWSDEALKYAVPQSLRLGLQATYRCSPQLDFYTRAENLNNNLAPDAYGYQGVGASIFGGIHYRFF